MKTRLMKIVSLVLSSALLMPFCVTAFAGEARSYEVESPYEQVDWSLWGAYKGNLHTHSTVSDAGVSMAEMIEAYYNEGFDFLAMSEHGVTGRAWNVRPVSRPLYYYQSIIGKKKAYLSDEQYRGMTGGTYPLAATAASRGFGMTCVTGANELNAVTATKSHVNGYFLPENVGNANIGYENGFEYAIRLADKNGGLSHINHPCDWLGAGSDESIVADSKNIDFFANLFEKYPSCLGMEVFNGGNNTEKLGRILWDNILTEVLPYGRTVFGFSNGDTHYTDRVDSSFSVFMMEKNDVDNIKKTMQSGAFFGVTRRVHPTQKLGPAAMIDAVNSDIAYPMFTNIAVDGHKITVNAKNFNHIQWIANGEIISEKTVAASSQMQDIVLDLDSTEGSEKFLYVRAEISGEGGMCFTQPFVIDDGSASLKYEDKTTLCEKIIFMLKSTRVYVLVREIINAIKK